jgi:hypothetical protein
MFKHGLFNPLSLIILMNLAIYAFVLVVVLVLMASPISLAAIQNNNYIDVNSAILEGNSLTSQRASPYLNYYIINYVVTNSSSDFVVTFSPLAKPLQSSIIPQANCTEVTTQFLYIFFRTDGYVCDFGSISQGTRLSIQFENIANPLSNIFRYFGV